MTDIISRSPMHNDEFINKVAESIWLLMESRVEAKVKTMIENISVDTNDDDFDDKVSNWMSNYFDWSDYFDMDIRDYDYDINNLINENLEDREFKVTLPEGKFTVTAPQITVTATLDD